MSEILDEYGDEPTEEFPWESEAFVDWVREYLPKLDDPQRLQLVTSGTLSRIRDLIDSVSRETTAFHQVMPDDASIVSQAPELDEAVRKLEESFDLVWKYSTTVDETGLAPELKDKAHNAWRELRWRLHSSEVAVKPSDAVQTHGETTRPTRSQPLPPSFSIAGVDAHLVEFEFFTCYDGFVEGYPNPWTNAMVFQRALERAGQLSSRVSAHMLEPELRPAPDGLPTPSDWEELPTFCCIGRFSSMWEELILVWFQDELPTRIGGHLAERIHGISWEKLAPESGTPTTTSERGVADLDGT